MATSRSKYSLLGRFNFEDLYNAFLAMEQRQQVLLGIGALGVLVISLVLPISCAGSKLRGMEKDYDKERQARLSLMERVHRYQDLKSRLKMAQEKLGKAGTGSLTTVIESLANEVEIGQNIERLKPITLSSTDYFEEEGVDGVISKINLDQATHFLQRVDQYVTQPLTLKKMQIKPRYGKRDELTLTFQVSAMKLKGTPNE